MTAPGPLGPTSTSPSPPAAPPPPPQGPPRATGPRPRTAVLGAFGEALAARHLGDAGMVVLDRNWRCELGELDLVLRDGDVLVVCEVKTRSSVAFGSPLEAVDERKVARLRRLAARWLDAHAVRPREVRIDLVGVLVPGDGPVRVEHVPGVG